jgi:tRNA-(ms[2]io[6]A)-hydroxylase
MAKKSADLCYHTPAEWAQTALADLPHFLADHANCERKASAMAMSLIVRFPDREAIMHPMMDLAIEELEHFRQCYQFMAQRGIALIPDSKDPYVRALLQLQRYGREEYFLDQLLICSLVESRGAERFRLVSEGTEDPELKAFYKSLWATEARHGHLFADLATRYFDETVVYERLQALAEEEGKIVAQLPWRSALH